MNFRTRLVAAASTVVAIAVVLACASAYHISRDSLVGEVDSSLHDAFVHMTRGQPVAPFGGIGAALILPSGYAYFSSAAHGLPIDAGIIAVAQGKATEQYRTIVWDGAAFRELIEPIPRGTEVGGGGDTTTLATSAALVVFEPIQGLEEHLHSLWLDLLFLAIGGVLVAALFGWLAARASLVPLERTTKAIEDVANTLDVSRRVDEGRDDELGRLRRACNRLLEALQGAQSAQRQLILDSSHELRTPLTSLRMNAQVLGRLDELNAEDIAQLGDDMVTQVDELTTLVGDLVELARGEHSVEDAEDIDLDELVNELTDVAETHARPKHVTISLDAEHCVVHARRSRLARAVGNLLDNAIKFVPEGGEVQVTVRSGVVTVEDDGPGLDPVDVPHVFDRFYRSSRDRGLPGSGLGLAIVAQVAAEAEGTVVAGRSERLGGTSMVLRLPLAGNGSEGILRRATPPT